MRFWDASAVIPLCLKEPQTASLREILKKDQHIVVWWGTSIECYSALARLRRDGSLDDTSEEQARNILRLLANAWTEVEPTEQVRETTERLLRLHPLRAADSLQLAAALVWAEKTPRGHSFVSLDTQLRQAAHLEGFALLPEKIP